MKFLKKFTKNFARNSKLWEIFENQFDIKIFNNF